jgi:hypothetical protein
MPGLFIIDDTLAHHSKMCQRIFGVQKHFDHVKGINVKAICFVFLYFKCGLIKFPLGFRIYFRNRRKTKHALAIELIKEALDNGFMCEAVLADSWYCVDPFVRKLQALGVRYILDIKTNATIDVPLRKKHTRIAKCGRKRQKWYEKENIVEYFKRRIRTRGTIGFQEDLETGKKARVLYTIKEATAKIHALKGQHKVIMTHDPVKGTTKYLITNEVTWEGVKMVRDFFERWRIEEFFENGKQLLDLEGASVRGEQGVAITTFLVSCLDALLNKEVVKLAFGNPQSAPVTVQSIVRLAELENVERFTELVRSETGKEIFE